MEQVSLDAMIEWVKEDPAKVQDLMQAEKIVRYGSIMVTYKDGRYMHLDAMPRLRSRSGVDGSANE